MPANEFEKQVQQQLDELRLNPSASVWENVEEQIREKKRRRTIFFFILPLALLLITFSVYYFGFRTASLQADNAVQHPDTEHAGGSTETKEIQDGPVSPAKNNTNNTPANQETGDQASQRTGEEIGENRNNTDSQEKNERKAINSDKKLTATRLTRITESRKITAIQQNNDKSSASLEKRQNKARSTLPITTSATGEVKSQKKNGLTREALPSKKETDSQQPRDPETPSLKPVQPAIKDTSKVDTAFAVVSQPMIDSISTELAKTPTPKKAVVNEKKWKWGITAAAGRVSNQTSPFSLEKSYAPNRDAMTGGPQTGSGTGSPQSPVPPSSVEPGSAFKLGMVVVTKVSKKSSISAGLQYVYLSNRIRTGQLDDTVILVPTGMNNYAAQVDQIYRGVPQRDFTNKYHFISMPVAYHLQLNKSSKLPVQWDLGGSASYMIATNALVYSGGLGGIYFHDKSMFNKLHFNVATGLSVKLHANKGTEWVLGPEFSFALNPLIKGEKQQYMLYGGISAKILFADKKL